MLQIFIKGKTAELLPATNDPPLNLHVPKPSLTNSHSHSAFGFCAMAIPDMDHPQDANMDNAYKVNNHANKMDTDADANIPNKTKNNTQPSIQGRNLGSPLFFTY